MHFVLVGKNLEGPGNMTMLDYVLKQAGPFQDRVLYLGVLRHAELYPIIEHARAVVLPSLVDNFPNTMLEAMALGRVVIGTQGTSFEEFIDSQISGILVNPGDPDSLSKAMETAYTMPDQERELVAFAAREKVRLLNPDRACQRLEEYFHSILNKATN
jgi:glycosyltransferase involved in cell wall biosynthesis